MKDQIGITTPCTVVAMIDNAVFILKLSEYEPIDAKLERGDAWIACEDLDGAETKFRGDMVVGIMKVTQESIDNTDARNAEEKSRQAPE